MTKKSKTKNWEQRFNESIFNYNQLKITNLAPLASVTTQATQEQLTYLGGFVEGEGSITMNIRRSPTARFGLFVDPEFALYQSNRNIQHLFTLCHHFKAGTVYVGTLKQPNLDVTKNLNYNKASFRVGSRQVLSEKVIPYLQKYVIPYAGPYFKRRFERWLKAIDMFNQQVHLSAVGMYSKMIPAVIELRAITPRTDVIVKLNTVEDSRAFLIQNLKTKLVEKNIDINGLNDLEICDKFDKNFPHQKGGRN